MSTPTAAALVGSRRPLVRFSIVALPTGWVMLSLPLLLDLPVEPFVLATLVLGLVLPALTLTRRDPGASVRTLLRDTVRLPGPWWLLVPAALLVPVTVAAVASAVGGGVGLSTAFLVNLALANVLSSLVVVNLWEEMAWAGFVQRRATLRWGYLGGSLVTTVLFTGVHLPLTLYGAEGPLDVGANLGAMLASGLGMRLLIGAFDVWGGGSILTLGLIHATFNASAELVVPSHDWVRYAVTLALGLAALTLRGAMGARPGGDRSSSSPTPAAVRVR